ncbi:MAG TPA: hypothetical protein VKE24_02910 [Candidatus Acidoferrales bacterium]|nr:hypothetical protein [Candidatus Acidoferrales bacterium]
MGRFNYFNYFTEIEEYFWRKRGAHLLVSPLDWAIVETWQRAGIPLEAVRRGIDRAFESYRRSRRGTGGRSLKSLAYCVDAVLDAAEQEREASAGLGPETDATRRARPSAAGEAFSREELHAYFERNSGRLVEAAAKVHGAYAGLAARIRETGEKLRELLPLLDSPAELDLEDLERRLTVLEQKLTAALTASASEDDLLEIHREMDRQLLPYRRKMTAAQLDGLERQYTQKRLFEKFELPRLSLFYLT